jgi:hypothetical protein
MSFKGNLAADRHNVFLNLREFAQRVDIGYDGACYKGVPAVLSGIGDTERKLSQGYRDNMQGLYRAESVLRCAAKDIGGRLPEKGQIMSVRTYGDGYARDKRYYVASSWDEMGMFKVELAAVDE